MSTATAYFETRAIRFARTLPVAASRRFLRGLLESAHAEAFPRLRLAYTNLCIADDQFKRIAQPRGRRPLDKKDISR